MSDMSDKQYAIPHWSFTSKPKGGMKLISNPCRQCHVTASPRSNPMHQCHTLYQQPVNIDYLNQLGNQSDPCLKIHVLMASAGQLSMPIPCHGKSTIDPGHNAKTFDGIRMHAPAIDLLVDQPKNCSQTINRAGEQTANELAIHAATIPRRRSTTSQDSQSMRHQQALDWGNQSIHVNHMPHAYMGQSTLDPCHNAKLSMTSLNANPMPHACTVHATRY